MLKSLLFVAGTSTSLAAQVPVAVGLQVDASDARIRGVSPTLATADLVGGRGSALFGPLRLSLVYREGRLRLGATQPLLVEGWATADVQLLPWLRVGLGPGARAYQLDSTTLRREWLAGRVGLDVPLIGRAVRADLRLWRSFVTFPPGTELTRAEGGEVGIAYWSPVGVWIGLATTFDDMAFLDQRHERLTGLRLGMGIGR
ncbi:MAG TPA: hypothetical protein VIW26_03060 [Gemmatimonadales bacterium]